MPVIGLNHTFEKNSAIMTQLRANEFSVKTLNKNNLDPSLNELDGVILYTIEEHEAVFEWIVALQKRSSLPIWVCVPQKKVKVQSLLYLHLGVDGVFEAEDLDELMVVMKRSFIREEPFFPEKQATSVALIPEKMSVNIDRSDVTLTKLEYDLLSILLEHSGAVLTYKQLRDVIWQESSKAGTNAQLANLVCSLRNKLRLYQDKLRISTIRTKGYSLMM